MDLITQEATRRLIAAFSPTRIFLFGSRAKGPVSDNSDYDFLVVVKESTLPRYRRNIQGFRALKGLGIAKDVIVLTESEFQSSIKVVCSLPATVQREGILLHAA